VTGEDDVERWWNSGWGKTGLLRGKALPLPFVQNVSHIDWFVNQTQVCGW
jgi:hypothetical protein